MIDQLISQLLGSGGSAAFEKAGLGKLSNDAGDALQMLRTMWESREKVMAVVDFVWDNREKLGRAIDFIGEHGDQLAALATAVPDLLGRTGATMEAAGRSAVNAAEFLAGAAGDAGAGVRQLAELLASLGQELDRVRIPTLKPKFSEVMGFKVVSGVDVDELKVVDQAARRLREGAEIVRQAGGGIAGMAEQVRDVGGRLLGLGRDLGATGADLGAGEAASFVATAGSMKSTAKKSGAKKSTAKKSTAKKSTAKKSTAKKSTVKKSTAKKSTVKKSTAKKSTVKKSTVKKSTAKKSTAKKGARADD